MTMPPKSPAFDPTTVEARTGTSHPAAFRTAAAGRLKRRLGEHGGLSGFGVNRSATEASDLEVGDRVEGDEVEYPDADMQVRYVDGDYVFVRRGDGSRYE